MFEAEIPWLTDPVVREIVMPFPMPLAVVGRDGAARLLNRRFAELFDPSLLDTAAARTALREPGQPCLLAQVPCRDGRKVDARAQALRIGEALLLVVDETPGGARSGEIDRMRERIGELERLSSTDHLTGAWNRAHFNRVAEHELARSLRFRQPLSLLLLDIDHFKRVNDTWGHRAGDSVLRELAQLLKSSIRRSDSLFRWGGEEFVVLATSTGHRNAAVLAEGLRRRVEQRAFATVGKLTVSVGIAEHLGAEPAEAWFGRADASLYSAKNGGRNRIVVDRQGNSDLWAERGASLLRLEWQEAYQCGEPTIDRQHRELFDLANALIDAALARSSSQEPLVPALDRLLAHVARHFEDEEKILARHGYDALARHCEAHAHLLARAGALRRSAESGEAGLGSVVEFLANDVVARHLFVADRDYFPLLRGSGRPSAQSAPNGAAKQSIS